MVRFRLKLSKLPSVRLCARHALLSSMENTLVDGG